MTGIFQVSDSGSSPDIGIREPTVPRKRSFQLRQAQPHPSLVGGSMSTARGAIKVCVAQRLEHSAVNRKVAGSIPVANVLEQLLELREPTVSLENLVFNCASGARTLPSRKEGFKGNLGSPSLG